LTVLPEALRPIAEYRMVIYSLALVVIMIARPQGLFGDSEVFTKLWRLLTSRAKPGDSKS